MTTMNKVINSLDDLRAEKALVKERNSVQEQRVRAMVDIKLMKLLVPDIIRDENNNIDFTKAIVHIGIASLPLLYKKLKDENDAGLQSILDSLGPLLEIAKDIQKATAQKA